ncbi:ParB/RepB/Spo0J family partition protein [Shimia ponticola]|uniref:ParB/RepB/Spo0J family partition protein n=1 Tax=Shimia ponticola TaxID=2582893 RepID=UPI0011BED3BE|nr:ParB/RepB/Spo0J family partition protein [Shimia ponticola]
MAKDKKRGLGRGLSALMADVEQDTAATPQTPQRPDTHLPIERVFPNPDQPRRSFDQSDLDDLAASIRQKGIIQPLIVRARPGSADEYEIVAGERRWRAAQLAQLHEVPVVIRDFTDTEVLEVAIIENIQRADLNPVEEALGFQQLLDRFGHTQEQLGEVLGKSRSYIANILRLLTLPLDVQELLKAGKLSAGHARALITSDNASDLAAQVVAKGLSVRETEKLAKGTPPPAPKPKAPKLEKDADTRALENDLSAALGMKVAIDHKAGGEAGAVTIKYTSLDQLDDLCARLAR